MPNMPGLGLATEQHDTKLSDWRNAQCASSRSVQARSSRGVSGTSRGAEFISFEGSIMTSRLGIEF